MNMTGLLALYFSGFVPPPVIEATFYVQPRDITFSVPSRDLGYTVQQRPIDYLVEAPS